MLRIIKLIAMSNTTIFIIIGSVLVVALLCAIVFRKTYKETHYEGTEIIKTKSVVNKEGEKNGKEILYDRDGKKNKVSHWVNGVREGDFTVYWSNGKPYIKGTYRNGKLWGHYIVYDKTGKKIVFEKDYN